MSQDTLAGFCAALKIDFRIIRSEILPLFESLNWIDVKRRGNTIEKIEAKIPPAEDILSTLGARRLQKEVEALAKSIRHERNEEISYAKLFLTYMESYRSIGLSPLRICEILGR